MGVGLLAISIATPIVSPTIAERWFSLPGFIGLAPIPITTAVAFAAVYWGCATGYYSFAHEIGHLQSARHDPSTDPSTSPYSYGHGYRYTGSPDWRTIMAYDCPGGCPRLNYWSSPLKLYNGVAMGTASQSDNARVLNNTRNTVAAATPCPLALAVKNPGATAAMFATPPETVPAPLVTVIVAWPVAVPGGI